MIQMQQNLLLHLKRNNVGSIRHCYACALGAQGSACVPVENFLEEVEGFAPT
jgi:hypothetical protein